MILKFHGDHQFTEAASRIDADDDGMPEISDPWGNPVEWLRWAPGYGDSPGGDGAWGVYKDEHGNEVDDDGTGVLQGFNERHWNGSDDYRTVTPMVKDWQSAPDPFNPLRIGVTGSNADETPRDFGLYPLVYSAGPDGQYEINKGKALIYRDLPMPCDPYYSPPGAMAYQVGTPLNMDGDGVLGFIDNVTNHATE